MTTVSTDLRAQERAGFPAYGKVSLHDARRTERPSANAPQINRGHVGTGSRVASDGRMLVREI